MNTVTKSYWLICAGAIMWFDIFSHRVNLEAALQCPVDRDDIVHFNMTVIACRRYHRRTENTTTRKQPSGAKANIQNENQFKYVYYGLGKITTRGGIQLAFPRLGKKVFGFWSPSASPQTRASVFLVFFFFWPWNVQLQPTLLDRLEFWHAVF